MVIFANYTKKSEKIGLMNPNQDYFKCNFSALPNNLSINNSVNKNLTTFYYVQKSFQLLKDCKFI